MSENGFHFFKMHDFSEDLRPYKELESRYQGELVQRWIVSDKDMNNIASFDNKTDAILAAKQLSDIGIFTANELRSIIGLPPTHTDYLSEIFTKNEQERTTTRTNCVCCGGPLDYSSKCPWCWSINR